MYRQLVKLLPFLPASFLFVMSIIVVLELLKLIPPYIFKLIIDAIILSDFKPDSVLYLIIGFFVALTMISFLDWLSSIPISRRIYSATNILLEKTFTHLLHLDVGYHEKNDTGSLVTKLIRGYYKVIDLFFQFADNYVRIILQTIITAGVLFWMEPRIGLVFILILPVICYITVWFSIKTQPLREKYNRVFESAARDIAEASYNVRTVQDFGCEHRETQRVRKSLNTFLKQVMVRMKNGALFNIVRDSLSNLARVSTLFLSIYFLGKGILTPGDVVFISALTEKAFINLIRLGRAYHHVEDARTSVERFTSINDEVSPLLNVKSGTGLTDGKVVFQNVSFQYAGKPVLHNLSFSLLPRKVVAIVGRSGAGKTTIAKLLFRYFDVTAGKIMVDGKDIREYNLQTLRTSMAKVSQDVELFNTTVLKNIVYGCASATFNDVVRAAKIAHCHDFIEELPKGYHTLIGERGVKLSGGQKQRLAIARAILMKPKLIIFDEATSALDSESERAIREAMYGLMGTCTMLIIAHRFATIEHADHILLLDKGKIVEQGTHADLIQKGGLFKKLRDLQKLGEIKS